jgi:hypothetical protein
MIHKLTLVVYNTYVKAAYVSSRVFSYLKITYYFLSSLYLHKWIMWTPLNYSLWWRSGLILTTINAERHSRVCCWRTGRWRTRTLELISWLRLEKFVNKTMKNIGLDVKLLKIGLQYAQLRATGGNFLQLFSSQDNVKLEVDPSNYQNLTYLHAMVIL